MTESAKLQETPVATEENFGKSRTFWSRVGAVYRSRLLNRFALYWVFLLICLAVFVPFIANASPYTCIINGKRHFPLFRNLTAIDLILLVAAAAITACYVAFKGIEKRGGEIEERREARFRWIGSILLVATLICIALGIFKDNFLDENNYQRLAHQGKLSGAIYAPLRWGYKDYEPLDQDRLYEKPSGDHLLGTDGNGRDALARLLYGTRVALAIGVVSEVIALIIGVILGALMGYFSGLVDMLGMRLVEIFEAIPTLLLLITCVALFGRSLTIIMVVIGLTSWTGIATFVRAEFLRIRKLDYVQAAVATGLPLRSILFRHMLPNGLTSVIITFTFGVAGAVASESILSFLGVGVEPPTASWGLMLNEAGGPGTIFRWWLAIAPGFFIFLTVLAYNIIGEGLRDALDPQMNKVE